jgi:hypothetical protein
MSNGKRCELKLRREEVLRRHQTEIERMDGDQAELETLNHLVEAFMTKFNPV